MGKLVYIAGPVTDTPDFRERFKEGCLEVARLGHKPVSPVDLPKPFTDTGAKEIWLACMRVDIPALINCDAIYLLRGWENSRGARLEKLIAEGLGLEVMFQEGAERG